MFKRSRHELQKSTHNCMAKDMGEQSEDNIAVAVSVTSLSLKYPVIMCHRLQLQLKTITECSILTSHYCL